MYISAGAVFTPINGAKTFLLKEWKPTGVDYNDNFQLLSPANAATIARYCYVTKAAADEMSNLWYDEPGWFDHAIGWWIPGEVDWMDEAGTSEFRADNVVIGAGQGILVAAGDVRPSVKVTFPSALEATK